MRKRRRIYASVMAFMTAATLVCPAAAAKADDSSVILSDGLKVWFDFDGDTLDMTGRKVTNRAEGSTADGTLASIGDASSTSITEGTGISGKGLTFTGQNAESYLQVDSIINSSAAYTVSLWVKYDAGASTDATAINIVQQTGTGRTVLFTKNKKLGGFVAGADLVSTDTVPYGEWVHLVVSGGDKDEATSKNSYGIWMNGKKVVDQTVNYSALSKDVTNLRFGCHKNTNTGNCFTGDMDSIRVYDRAADDALVAALFKEHGGAILYRQLETVRASAQSHIDAAKLPADNAAYAALKTAVDNAGNVTADSAYDDVEAAVTAIREAIAAYETALTKLPVDVTISADQTIRTIPDYMFGVNHRYHMDGYGSWDTANRKLYDEFKALSDSAQFGSVRYPGGIVANLFQWKRSLGEPENRIKTIHGNWDEPNIVPNFGIDEAARYIIDDLGAEMIYVYNFGNGSAQDAADLVEYLNCEVGENPNGGIDWAKVRADNGHPEPYGVTNFEIGNELNEGRGYWMQSSPNALDSWGNDDKSKLYAEGARMTFTNEKTAELENWNTTNDKTKASCISDGTANQKKYMRYANDVTDQTDKSKMVERNSVKVYVGGTEWTVVDDLSSCGATETACEVNCENGEIRFGDGTHGAVPAKDAEIRVTYTVYKDGISDYYDAMKAVDPSVKIYSGFASANLPRVIKNSAKAGADGGKFDGMVVHPYSFTNQIDNSDIYFYQKALSVIETTVYNRVKEIQEALNQQYPDGSKEICTSEFGIFKNTGDVVQSQAHAIYIAENFMRFIDWGMSYSNKHCLIDFPGGDVLGPGKQALILANAKEGGGYDFYGTPSLEALKIFNKMSGTSVLKTEIENNSTFYGGTLTSVDVLSTKDKDGNVYVIAVNMDRNARKTIDFTITGADLTGKAVEAIKLEASDVYAINSVSEPNKVKAQEFSITCDSEKVTYTMRPYSIFAFKAEAAAEPDAAEADKSGLTAAIRKASGLLIQTETYSAESLAALQAKRGEALTVLNDDGATAEQVQAARTALQQAIDALGSSKYKKGDLNGDGAVNLLDLRQLLRYICGKEELSAKALEAADVTGEDGTVNLSDLRAILRYICGKTSSL